MKPLTDKGARAAVARLKDEIARLVTVYSHKDVADLVEWAERKLKRR